MALSTLTERQLLTQLLAEPNNRDLIANLIHTIFAPRFIDITTTAVTLTEIHRGAYLRLLNASQTTVTLPTTLGASYLTSIIAIGAGGATISGTHIGGSTVAQNGFASMFTQPDGSWFVTGAA